MEEHLNPKLQRILRYFCSLVVACFGVAVSSQYPALGNVRFYFLYAKWLFKTHLTPSYRLFSILDATPIYRIGAPPLVAVKSATVNGRSVSSFSVRPFWDTVGGGVPTARGIGRHPSMPSARIGLHFSNLLASTVITLLRTSLSNRTGRGTSHVKGAVYLVD